MPINPIDTIRDETTLLKLFKSIMCDSIFVDMVFKDILKEEKNIKQKIHENTNKRVPIKFSWKRNNFELMELNKQLETMKIKCTFKNLSCKEAKKRFESNEFKIKRLEFEPAFKCQKCHTICDNKDDLKKHIGINHSELMKSRNEKNVETRLTLLEENSGCLSVPLAELIEGSGLCEILNKKLEMMNLKCSIKKIPCKDVENFEQKVEHIELLEFEPTIRCYKCWKIFDNEHELKEHENKHQMEQKEYFGGISKQKALKRQQERDEYLKSRDRTR